MSHFGHTTDKCCTLYDFPQIFKPGFPGPNVGCPRLFRKTPCEFRSKSNYLAVTFASGNNYNNANDNDHARQQSQCDILYIIFTIKTSLIHYESFIICTDTKFSFP